MAHQEKLTVMMDDETREALAKWAADEGRPVGNLLRRIARTAIEQRQRHLEGQAVTA